MKLIIVMVDGQRQNNTMQKHKYTRVHTEKYKEKVKELGTIPIDYYTTTTVKERKRIQTLPSCCRNCLKLRAL